MNTDIRDYLFNSSSKKEAVYKAKIVEAQEKIQRFASTFEDRINQVSANLEKELPEKAGLILRQHLLYTSSAIEIATGPSAELNLLDMLAFIHLSSDRVKTYWIPQEYGGAGVPLTKVFEQSEGEIWEIISEYTNLNQRAKIRDVLENWKRNNPNQILVERVRLTEAAGVRGKNELAKLTGLSGIFHGVKEAFSAADEGLLMANRALFLLQRYPGIIRLESRLTSEQIIDIGIQKMLDVEGELAKMQREATPFVEKLTSLTKEARSSVEESSKLIKTFHESFPGQGKALERASALLPDLIPLLRSLNDRLQDSSIKASEIFVGVRRQVSSLIWSGAFAIMAVSASIGVIWFIGIALLKWKNG